MVYLGFLQTVFLLGGCLLGWDNLLTLFLVGTGIAGIVYGGPTGQYYLWGSSDSLWGDNSALSVLGVTLMVLLTEVYILYSCGLFLWVYNVRSIALHRRPLG